MLNLKTVLTVLCTLIFSMAFSQKITVPQFAGCESVKNVTEKEMCIVERLDDFLLENTKYPAAAVDQNIDGQVVVIFDVDNEGDLINPTVIESLGYGCDEEALRLISEMPRWEPAKIDGEPTLMAVQLKIPFSKTRIGLITKKD